MQPIAADQSYGMVYVRTCRSKSVLRFEEEVLVEVKRIANNQFNSIAMRRCLHRHTIQPNTSRARKSLDEPPSSHAVAAHVCTHRETQHYNMFPTIKDVALK